MILRDYEADSKTGYVINLDHYIESRCHVLNISEYKDDILMIISKTIKPFVCTVLT